MTSQELRLKFINFFKNHSDLPHQEISSASLVPSEEEQLVGKEKVLFTSAGMQPLIPYLTGQKEPPSKRLVDVQKCLRTDDIEEVGDEVHHTFFEMLGNWSIGDYWKEGAIKLSFEFLTKELEIPIEKLAITVFAGDGDAPKDEESAGVWKSLGIPEDRIFYFGKSHNWWPTGEKSGLCGPDTEMFYWIGEGGPEGKPNEDSRWVEIWNDVFMQFNRKEDGSLENLPQRNVDTGMGLERTLAALNGKKSDYETDLFEPIIKEIEKSKNNYSERSKRIIADHLKAAVFLMAEGIKSQSNDPRGSVLARLLSGAITQNNQLLEDYVVQKIIDTAINIYEEKYQELKENKETIHEFMAEAYRLIKEKSSPDELREKMLAKFTPDTPITTASGNAGNIAFDYHQRMGTPQPIIFGTASELIQQVGLEMDNFKKGYEEAFRQHQQVSKGVEAGKFKGGLADQSEVVTKYHTATHLLHQALRDVLGPEVFQKGSNITSERLRFDFSFERKMTEEEIKEVEDIINKKITEDLRVDRKIVSPTEAKNMGAIGLFDEKYGSEVSIYGVGPGYNLDPKAKDQRERNGYYSLEFCGGPHVEATAVIGKIEIIKEEAVSAGIRRIRAQIVLK
ncbi:alanine--tRNA ligase [Candidatus Daviesbacteria bacterium]|nr:alanine--tRNA ligase [Candidatus Daviesbacteria bacterium]